MVIIDQEVLRGIKKQIQSITNTINKLENKAHKLVKANAGEVYKNLLSTPSVGAETATMLITLTNEFKNFHTCKQLASYIGICPRVYQSGTSVNGKGKICKMGMSRMRATLFIWSLTAIRGNKACREMYERLTQNGKPKKVALIAVMNKLLKQAFAIATKNQKYMEIILN
jgi:transposase